jgi:hypothetical protein
MSYGKIPTVWFLIMDDLKTSMITQGFPDVLIISHKDSVGSCGKMGISFRNWLNMINWQFYS